MEVPSATGTFHASVFYLVSLCHRDSDDDEWPATAAVLALVKLQALQETESQENGHAINRELNHSAPETGKSQGENNAAQKSQESSLQLIHNPVYESRSDANDDTALIEDTMKDMDV